MKHSRFLVAFAALLVGSVPLVNADATLRGLTNSIQARDGEGFRTALNNRALFPTDGTQGTDRGRFELELALVAAPPTYLQGCLDHGFDPNAVVEFGGPPGDGGASGFYRGTFFYQVLLSGRTELLHGLKPTPTTRDLKNASIRFQSRTLVRLLVETLSEAALRMGDTDSRNFAATLGSVGGTDNLIESRLGDLIQGQVNDDQVRLRSGPGVSFPAVGQVDSGSAVTVVESGPTRYLSQEPWADRWFRVQVSGKIAWVWGRYLDLPFEHGGRLTGPLLVDFLLWKQKLYQDVWNRAQESERWRFRSLVEWAIQLQDRDFLRFLSKNNAPDAFSLGEENESLVEKLVRERDLAGLEFWIDVGYHLDYDRKNSYGNQTYVALLDMPQLDVYRLFVKGAYPFEALRTSQGKNGGGDSWGSTMNTASEILGSAPVSVLLDLIPQWRQVNQLFVTWGASYSGYSGVHVWSLLDRALDRGDSRLVAALKKRGALSRDQLVQVATGVPAIPEAKINDRNVRLRSGPGVGFSVIRVLDRDELITLLDEGPITTLPGDSTQGRWVYGKTKTGELGWVWGAFLFKST